MKKLTILALAASSFLIACQGAGGDQSSTTAQQEVAAEKGTVFTLDTLASSLKWTGYHKGGLNPRFGTLKGSGTVAVDADTVTGGSFVIDMTAVATDAKSVDPAKTGGKTAADLDAHLKNADFFEVEKYPTAKFEISSTRAFDATKDKSALTDANVMVSGNLTIKDKTVNVTFPAKISVSTNELTLASKFTINRQDWGLSYGTEGSPQDWMISQEIDIELNLVAKK